MNVHNLPKLLLTQFPSPTKIFPKDYTNQNTIKKKKILVFFQNSNVCGSWSRPKGPNPFPLFFWRNRARRMNFWTHRLVGWAGWDFGGCESIAEGFLWDVDDEETPKRTLTTAPDECLGWRSNWPCWMSAWGGPSPGRITLLVLLVWDIHDGLGVSSELLWDQSHLEPTRRKHKTNTAEPGTEDTDAKFLGAN